MTSPSPQDIPELRKIFLNSRLTFSLSTPMSMVPKGVSIYFLFLLPAWNCKERKTEHEETSETPQSLISGLILNWCVSSCTNPQYVLSKASQFKLSGALSSSLNETIHFDIILPRCLPRHTYLGFQIFCSNVLQMLKLDSAPAPQNEQI